MFKFKNDGSIFSDKGFMIKILGRAGLEYSEGDKTMFIDSEIVNNRNVGYVIASSSISRWNGSTKKINHAEHQRILLNLKDAFKFIGYDIRIISSF